MLSSQDLTTLAQEISQGVSPTIDGGKGAFKKSSLDPTFFGELASHFFKTFSRADADTGHIRLILNGLDQHPSTFYNSRIGDGLITHSRLNDSSLNYCLRNGGTAVFDHVNDYSPVAKLLQEAVEARVGGACWIQCYVTQSGESAFNMHQDDHPFIICQVFGSKKWEHPEELSDHPSSVVYEPGDVAFYPRGYSHNVSGLGSLTMHLTVAFDRLGHDIWQLRSGNGLPYSLGFPVRHDTSARLSLRHHSWSLVDGKIRIQLGEKRLLLDETLLPVLNVLHSSPSTTPEILSSAFDLPVSELLAFWQFGFEQGLLFTPILSEGTQI